MQSDGLNSALSPIVYGDIALSIKINTQIHIHNKSDYEFLHDMLYFKPTHCANTVPLFYRLFPYLSPTSSQGRGREIIKRLPYIHLFFMFLLNPYYRLHLYRYLYQICRECLWL